LILALKPYFQLVRLPNLFTAAADPLAGFLMAGGLLIDVRIWLPLALAGVCLYAGGMILNDVFDYNVDLLERPNRPLPSGRVPRRLASILGFSLMIAGPCLAALSGLSSLIVAIILAGAVFTYDAGRTWPLRSPFVMGSCRALNLLLGMSVHAAMGGPACWLAAIAFGTFVVGVTFISGDEVYRDQTRGVKIGCLVQNVAILGLIIAAFVSARQSAWLAGIAVLLVAGSIVNRADLWAIKAPSSQLIQKAVKTGVLMLIWLDVGLVAASAGPVEAMAVASLWVPAFLLGKWVYST
jgi:4-hydroxybenzoate polyprenyltransferase